MNRAIAILQRAADLGLKLAVEPPNTLTYEPIENCSPAFEETLRELKPQLLVLLRLRFVMVDSEILGETIFFCENDDTKAALVEAGADEYSIYTKYEVTILCEANRIAPLSADDLRKIHEIKRTFNARITPR